MFARRVLRFYPALFPYPDYNRAPSALSRLCHSFVFSRLRTLSFFIPHLSRVPAIACALFPKKPGVHPYVVIPRCFLLVHTHPPLLLSPLFPLHTNPSLVCLLFPLLTQKQGVGGMSSQIVSLRSRLFRPCTQNVGAPTFLIFPLIFRTFLSSAHREGYLATCPPRKAAATQERSAGRSACATGRWALVTGHCSSPLSDTSRQYCAPIAWDLARTEAGGIPASSGSPRRGYVPFADRCADADD